jgi:hypothetical protein
MNVDALKTNILDYIKDIKLKLSALLAGTESVELDSLEFVALIVVAVYATRYRKEIQSFRRTFFLLLAGRRQKEIIGRRRKHIKR